jgi:hypothetical protein
MKLPKISWVLALGLLLVSFSRAAELKQLKVLYIGDGPAETDKSYTAFLKSSVKEVESVSRDKFKTSAAAPFDVVVLQWRQSGGAAGSWSQGSPLGKREEWSKPTVLLGSAGLNVAVSWKVRAGSG